MTTPWFEVEIPAGSQVEITVPGRYPDVEVFRAFLRCQLRARCGGAVKGRIGLLAPESPGPAPHRRKDGQGLEELGYGCADCLAAVAQDAGARRARRRQHGN